MDEAPAIEQAIAALQKETGVWCSDPFYVRAGNDDGGKYVEILIEREQPSERLDPWILEALPGSRYEGWRLIISKCPPGYIKVFVLNKKQKD